LCNVASCWIYECIGILLGAHPFLHIIRLKVKLCWVKAHAGIQGNELADTLAKKAATNESLTEKYNKIPKSVVTKELEEESVRKWQRNWAQTTKGRTTKEYFPNV
jgi:hypothetical protein